MVTGLIVWSIIWSMWILLCAGKILGYLQKLDKKKDKDLRETKYNPFN